MLDISAIEELRNKKVAVTDDSLKYRYASEEGGQYGEHRVLLILLLASISRCLTVCVRACVCARSV